MKRRTAALRAKGDHVGAMAEIREAIRLNPEEQAYRTQLKVLAHVAGGLHEAVAVTPASVGIKTDDCTKHVVRDQFVCRK